MSQASCKFYKYWREHYKWPPFSTREESENRIAQLLNQANNALQDLATTGKPLLRNIHQWKTQNQRGITDRYSHVLDENSNLIPDLQELFPAPTSLTSRFIKKLLDTLKIRNCNLPICSAQASFLCHRAIPVLDRFVAQFFSKTLSPTILDMAEFNMRQVLSDFSHIRLIIEDNGTHRCKPRLAVYQSRNYQNNRDLFVYRLIPELDNIAEQLNEQQIAYLDMNDTPKEFTRTDVEMAVFAFGTQNRQYFECWYDKQPQTLSHL